MKKVDIKETVAKDSPDKEATLGIEDQSDDTSTTEGVKLPEEFQKSAHSFVSGLDTDAKINYVRDCLSEQQSGLMSSKAETEEYSEEEMPK